MHFIITLAFLAVFCHAARAAESIEIQTDNGPLTAAIYRPACEGPFPAVIAVHGCEGARHSGGTIAANMDQWGRLLANAGFVAVFPDSFTWRGLRPRCRDRSPEIRAYRERVADIRTTRDWLQQQSFAQSERISLLGWGNGGAAVLWAVRPTLEPNDDRPDFRSAVTLHPRCRRLADTAWSARIPTLILIGALDNWSSVSSCEQMVANARGRTARAMIVKYKDAHRKFDRDNLSLRRIRGVAFSPDGSGGEIMRANVDARADAIKRIREWFAR